MSNTLVINTSLITASEAKYSKQAASVATKELYGLRCSSSGWGALIAKYLILNEYDCNGFSSLNQIEADCLLGKLSEDLTVNCE